MVGVKLVSFVLWLIPCLYMARKEMGDVNIGFSLLFGHIYIYIGI